MLFAFVLTGCNATKQYYRNEGYVFGTYYNIRYEASQDYEQEIKLAFEEFDNSLSMFNPNSTISRLNRGETTETDSLFDVLYATAYEISQLSQGAFDITVRPLVNFWGFGNSKAEGRKTEAQSANRDAKLDSIRAFVGYEKIHVENGQFSRDDNRLTMDASAIAKGYGVDVIANLLRKKGCTNLLVDIGGEVVAVGHNSKGKPWRIGISKPKDDPDGTENEIEEIIEAEHIAMATSGNYRQYYQEGNIRRSHTIDPRNGYPVSHSLLSATVVAETCIKADALATACMVLGAEEAVKIVERIEGCECYLIVAAADTTQIITSKGWTCHF